MQETGPQLLHFWAVSCVDVTVHRAGDGGLIESSDPQVPQRGLKMPTERSSRGPPGQAREVLPDLAGVAGREAVLER